MTSVLDDILKTKVPGAADNGGQNANPELDEHGKLKVTPPAAAAAAEEGAEELDEQGKPKAKPAAAAAAAPAAPVVDEQAVLAFLKTKGIEVASLADINKPAPAALTPAELKEANEKKQTEMLAYGLSNGKIKGAAEYNRYIADREKPARDIAFQIFSEERLAEDSTLTPEALEEEFKDENFEFLAEDDKKRIKAAKSFESQKAAYIQKKYGHIEQLEEDFDDHVQTQAARGTYNTQIDNVLSSLPEELTFEITDPADKKKTLPYKFKVPANSLKELEALYKKDEYFTLFKSGNLKDEDLSATFENSLKQKLFTSILTEVAHSHASAMIEADRKGRRGIPPNREDGGSEGTTVVGGNGISDQIIESQSKKS